MERRDLELIDAFLGMVGRTSLLEYYDLAEDAEDEAVEAAIKKRRAWAQGQQANPKFRNEAMWLIRRNGLVRGVLLENRAAYLAEVAERSTSQSLGALTPFIKGALASGTLTQEAESAIMRRGSELGLEEHQVRAHIDSILSETGTRRAADGEPAFKDYYEALKVSPNANADAIETAHRDRYRWARTLKDRRRAEDIYATLDEAWRVLQDPARRAEYDKEYREHKGGGQPGGTDGEVVSMGYLRGPRRDDDETPAVAPPSRVAPPLRVASPSRVTRPVDPTDSPTQSSAAPERRASSSRPPVRSASRPAPPKPPANIGKTVGIKGIAQRTRRSPRLSLASPELVTIKVGRKPVAHRIVVKNSGKGKMPGRVTSDREWLQVSRSRLDADARQQEVEVMIQPRQMPRNKGVALVTVVTDHGERRAITLRVERSSVPAPLLLGAAAVVVLLLLAALLLILRSAPSETGASSAAGPETALELVLDPSSDGVTINGEAVGSGDRLLLSSGFPVGREFTIEATLDGFKPTTERATVAMGTKGSVTLTLPLAESLDTPPSKDLVKARPNREPSLKVLNARRDATVDCLRAAPEGQPTEVSADIYIGATGGLIYVEFDEALTDQGVRRCMLRQLRAVKFPLLPGADQYAVLSDEVFSTSQGS